MKNTKGIFGASICVISVFVTQLFLRAIDATKFSTQISVTVILLVGILFAITMINSKEKVFGSKLNIISSILMLLMCLSIAVEIIYNDCFPQLANSNHILTLIIFLCELVTALTFVTFLGVAGSITSKKKKK